MLIAVCISVCIFLGLFASYALVAPGSQVLGETLVAGDGRQPRICLTFDDGPGEATPIILDILKKAGVRATFFLCGENVERFPEFARRIAAEGHEIGNHTYSHPNLFGKTPGRISWEIGRAQAAIERVTGCTPKLFRPPYGIRWFGLFRVLSQYELSTVMWSVSGWDWRLPPNRIVERVITKARPGSIVLLHDGVPLREDSNRQATIAALERIVTTLGDKYILVTISQL